MPTYNNLGTCYEHLGRLEEAAQADLLLHVVDVSSSNREEQIAQVNRVLHEIGADQVPQLMLLNKIDRAGMGPGLERDEYGKIRKIWISAQSGAGLDLVRQALAEHHGRLMVSTGWQQAVPIETNSE